MSWSAKARAACADLYGEIFALPFLWKLADGSLPPDAFARYLRQDALYLPAYARAMRRLAERLPEGEERALFVHFAEDGVAAEQAMQEVFLRGQGLGARGQKMSDACRRSIAHVERMGADAELPVAVAGVLPCFAVYAEVGEWLAGAVREGNPYGQWIAEYAGGDFAGDAAAAAAVCDGYAGRFPECRGRMLEAYREGVELEKDFWSVDGVGEAGCQEATKE